MTAFAIVMIVMGVIIGSIEKKRIERKQEHIEYLDRKQQEHLYREQHELLNLKKQKEQYERAISKLDYSSIPTKDQLKKLHWYMNYFGYIDSHNQTQLNQFYDKNYPKNPFDK